MTLIDDLNKKLAAARLGGGKERIKKQHEKGKLTARERVLGILDKGSFFETDALVTPKSNMLDSSDGFLGDGVVTGFGTINKRKVAFFAQDFTVYGGSLSEQHARKIVKIMDRAAENSCPIIGLNDSGGARIQEGVSSLAGYADIFLKNVLYSGLVPQISLILGPCAGGAVYSPAITDFIIMVDKTSHMFITGPEVIKEVTREEVNKEDLGGAQTHASKSGVAHFVAKNEKEAFSICHKLLSYLPQSSRKKPEVIKTKDSVKRVEESLNTVVPEDARKPYDIRDVVKSVADDKDFFEIQADFAKNMVIGFIRLDGQSIGIVANQPKHLAGCLDIDGSTKAARFVRCCDAFNIPILTLVDVPGFLPGVRQEHGGIIRHGSKLLFAFAEATVPKVTLITRKAYGGAYDVMSSKHLRADFNLAFPTAEIAVMGADGAVNIIYRNEISESKKPEETRKKLVDDYKKKFTNPWQAAGLGFVDAVIEPQYSREILCNCFSLLKDKKQDSPNKKHGNIPL